MSVRVIQGDCRAVLATLPDESVHCVVTSPPYWGLRSYGTPPQVWGGDPDCAHAWGDQQRNGKRSDLKPSSETTSTARIGLDERQGTAVLDGDQFCGCGAWFGHLGLEPSPDQHVANIVEVFRAVRRVLRRDGTLWLNYGDCYATGVNGRSAADTKAVGNDDRTFRDKPFSTAVGALKSKDLVMMPARVALALQADGWWLRSDIIWSKPNPMPESIADRPSTAHEHVFLLARSERYFYDGDAVREDSVSDHDSGNGFARPARLSMGGRGSAKPWKRPRGLTPRHEGHINHTGIEDTPRGEGRNLRNVWTIATAPFPEAHFATFPPALVEPCIKAGCPAGGTVLDPFGGSGTVGLVASKLGREATLIELNPAYVEIATGRLRTRLVDVDAPHAEPRGLPLFAGMPA